MAFRLANLPEGVPLVGKDGSASRTFARWWQTLRTKIETQEATQDELLIAITAALELAGIAVETAESALDASGAIMPDIAPVTIQADYTGEVLDGQLPRDIAAQRLSGDTDVTTSSDWTATLLSGGATFTIGAATGVLNLTALETSSVIEITSEYDGISRSKKLSLTKQLQDPPPSSASSTQYDSSISPTSSASYGSANAGPLTLTCGASGEISMAAPLSFSTLEAAGLFNCYGKWQISPTGAGTWSDVDTEIMSSIAAVPSEPGSIAVNQTATGLTPSDVYDCQLLLRNSSGTDTLYYSGTASASTS